MAMELRPYLDDLEARIIPDVEEDLIAQWRQFCRGECKEDVFFPLRTAKAEKPKLEWPKYSVNEALACPDKMLLQQLRDTAWAIVEGAGSPLAVRANYGVTILAMPFGCEPFVMSDESNTLPNCYPIGPERARAWLDEGMPDVHHHTLERVYDIGRRFMQIKRDYPKLGKYLWVYHPDLQGPMDVLELIWGSEIFLAFVDEPELIHRMLQMITDFYVAVMREWQEIVPNMDGEISAHWNLMQPGQIMVRDDSAMNLPPEYFREFIMPYDNQLLNQFGGGCVHACGRVDHWSKFLQEMPGARAFNLSQPNLNDMPKVLRDTIEKGILLLDMRKGYTEEAVRQGTRFGGKLHRSPS